MTDAGLHVMAIVDEASTMQLMSAVFGGAGDELVLATDLAEGLARAAAEVPEVVFIDVALGNGAGLALVHHLRAVSPDVSVFALAREADADLGSQVTALGGEGVLVLPLTGDELLTAVGGVRQRRAEIKTRRVLEAQAESARLGAAYSARVASAASAPDRNVAGATIAEVFVDATSSDVAMVYVPAGEGSNQLMRVADHGGDVPSGAPSFCEEMELHRFAQAEGLDVVPLSLGKNKGGLVALVGARFAAMSPVLEMLAAQTATTLALVQEREQSQRGAMKDPNSSAYTFAYFVDVAGREIDKARRHHRRFALATLVIEAPEGAAGSEATEMADKLLDIVRDTDVLARVDEGEFYLLLPETGGAGAHTLRRRVMRHTGGDGRRKATEGGPELTMGVATYPHDGTDLSRLLRVAKHRADASLASVVRRLELERQPLAEVVDLLLWHLGDPTSEASRGIEAPRDIELPAMDFMSVAVAAAHEAIRGGNARIVATERSGMSVGGAVRAALGTDQEGFQTVDLSKVPDCSDLEALCVIAEHGAYALVGRSDQSLIRAVHACDPLLVDLLVQRLGEAAGVRLAD